MYPCNCDDMKWLVDNYDVVIFKDGYWLLKWVEFDRVGIKSNIQTFSTRMRNCMFCGNTIKQGV